MTASCESNTTYRKIKKLLSKNGWSLYRLAKESGVPYSTLSNIVHRHSNPSITTLEKICDAFCISPNDLIAGTEKTCEIGCSIQERKLIKNFRALSDKDKNTVLQMTERLQQ